MSGRSVKEGCTPVPPDGGGPYPAPRLADPVSRDHEALLTPVRADGNDDYADVQNCFMPGIDNMWKLIEF